MLCLSLSRLIHFIYFTFLLSISHFLTWLARRHKVVFLWSLSHLWHQFVLFKRFLAPRRRFNQGWSIRRVTFGITHFTLLLWLRLTIVLWRCAIFRLLFFFTCLVLFFALCIFLILIMSIFGLLWVAWVIFLSWWWSIWILRRSWITLAVFWCTLFVLFFCSLFFILFDLIFLSGD